MDSKVFDIIEKEKSRQEQNVELIASENFVSENVLRAVGSCLTNKYSEGYPSDRQSGNKGRYYGGCYHGNEHFKDFCLKQEKKIKNCYSLGGRTLYGV